MNSYKNVTPAAIQYAALLLIETNGNTTTLDVKKLLRNTGYFAEQEEVSILMEQFALEYPLEWTDIYHPVIHRQYSLPAVSPATVPDGDEEDYDDILNADEDGNVTIAFDDDNVDASFDVILGLLNDIFGGDEDDDIFDDDDDEDGVLVSVGMVKFNEDGSAEVIDLNSDDDQLNSWTIPAPDGDETEDERLARVTSSVRDFYESLEDAPETVEASDDEDDDQGEDTPEQSFYSQVTPLQEAASNLQYQTKMGDTILLFRNPQQILDANGTVYRMTEGPSGVFYFCQNISRDLARSAHAGVSPDDYNEVRSTSRV